MMMRVGGMVKTVQAKVRGEVAARIGSGSVIRCESGVSEGWTGPSQDTVMCVRVCMSPLPMNNPNKQLLLS
jgi:hypothetical protein